MSEWQPIETAPKDGWSFLVAGELDAPFSGEEGLGVFAADYAYHDGKRWRFVVHSCREDGGDYGTATHWMPLPEPPESRENAA